MTLPLRLMILHFSHMGFTDGLTFMINLLECLDGPGTAEARPRLPAPVIDGFSQGEAAQFHFAAVNQPVTLISR